MKLTRLCSHATARRCAPLSPRALYSSLFYWALGILPFKDGFYSSSAPQTGGQTVGPEKDPDREALMATLSTAMVGPMDGYGLLNKTRVMATCRADGVSSAFLLFSSSFFLPLICFFFFYFFFSFFFFFFFFFPPSSLDGGRWTTCTVLTCSSRLAGRPQARPPRRDRRHVLHRGGEDSPRPSRPRHVSQGEQAATTLIARNPETHREIARSRTRARTRARTHARTHAITNRCFVYYTWSDVSTAKGWETPVYRV